MQHEIHINVSLNRHFKELLLRAATLNNQNLSMFLLNAAFENARQLLRDHQTILLSKAEHQRFLSQLKAPDAPNARLKAAARYYKKEFNERGTGHSITQQTSST